MERLDREIGAGGRRRSRRKDEQAGQRAQRGKRPEESRAERKDARRPSRRSTEAESRQRQGAKANSKVAPVQATQASTTGPSTLEPLSFQAHLTSKAPQQTGSPLAPATQAKKAPSTESTTPLSIAVPLQLQPMPGAKGAMPLAQAVGMPATAGGPRAPVTGTELALAPSPSNNKSNKSVQAAHKPDPAAAILEQAEAQEAQRSAQVLRQVRMQLHPGMRSVSIQLAPADLGRLSIRLRVETGEVQAIVRAESEEALAALERHIPELEAAFEDQGFEQMSFEFVLDQQGSPDPEQWRNGRDVSGQLETLIETKIDPALRGPQTLSDIEVDTYA